MWRHRTSSWRLGCPIFCTPEWAPLNGVIFVGSQLCLQRFSQGSVVLLSHQKQTNLIQIWLFLISDSSFFVIFPISRALAGCSDGTVVRVLASYHCGQGSIPRSVMWVEFVGSLLCTERFSPGTMVSPPLKNQHFTWLLISLCWRP